MTGRIIISVANYVFVIPSYSYIKSLIFLSLSLEDSIIQEEQPLSLSISNTSADTAPSMSKSISPVRKRKRVDSASGEVDRALLQSLKDIQESMHQRRVQKEDMHLNFALEVAGRLRRLPPRKNAFVKLQIQQLLFSVEFQDSETADELLCQGNAYL